MKINVEPMYGVCAICGKMFDILTEGSMKDDYLFCSKEHEEEYDEVKHSL